MWIFISYIISIMEIDKNNINSSNEESGKKIEDIQQNISKDITENITKTPRELADEAARILYEAFGTEYDINKKEGERSYHIAPKGTLLEQSSQHSKEWEFILRKGIVIIVTNTGKLNIRLNTKPNQEDNFYYYAAQVSNEILITEIENLKSFIQEEKIPSSSIFTKKMRPTFTPRTWNEQKPATESIDTLNTIPVLEKKYYSIPSLSDEQKKSMNVGETIEWWIKEESTWYINNKKCSIVIIKKYIEGEKKDAYVREYVDGVPEKFKGKQLFNEHAICNLWLTDRMPSDNDLQKILGKRHQGTSEKIYKKNNLLIKKFIQEAGLLNIGMYSGSSDDFAYIDSFRHHLLLKNGDVAEIDTQSDDIECLSGGTDSLHGYPIMLLKK